MHASVRSSLERPTLAASAGKISVGPLQMYYELRGAGPPLLLMHGGFSTIQTSFPELRDDLAAEHEVVALEQQGHGHTADIDRPLSYEQMVDDTAAALRQLGKQDVDVFGWSDGGIVALGLAVKHPDLVRRVAVMGAGYRPDAEPPEFRERMRALTPDNEHLAAFREHYQQVAPDSAAWPRLIEKGKAMYLAFEGWREEDMRALRAPLLVMLGDRDFPTLEHAMHLYRLVPDGRLAVLPDSDHAAPLTRAPWVTAMLRNFFRG